MHLKACLLLFLLPTLLHAELSTYRCGEPPEELVRHGKAGDQIDRYLEIVCDSPGETRYLSCDHNNQWMLHNNDTCPVPTCKLSDLPPQEDYGVRLEVAGNQLGDIVTFRCPSGRHISFRCQEKVTGSGRVILHWKPQNRTASSVRLKKLNCTVPKCKLSDLPHQENPVVRVEPARSQLGDIVTFRCPSGRHISFRCQEKITRGKGIKLYWKPQNRTSSRRLKTLDCTDFGECGVLGNPGLYTGNTADVYATAGTWRWVGGLYLYEREGCRGIPPPDMQTQLTRSRFRCGVSLITKGPNRTHSEWALTSAHCLYTIGGTIAASKLLVKFGSLNSNNDATYGGVVVGVERVFKHEDFSASTMLNDIALLKLKEHLPFTYDIRPVCLHKPNEGHVKVSSMAKMTGWGWLSMEDWHISPTLKQLSARIQSNESCVHSTSSITSKFHYPYNFCAGNVTVDNRLLSSCISDGGSPLVTCEKDGLKRVCTQIGIVSFGDGCGEPGKFGGYTNTTTYYDWIMSKMNTN